jgi:hypothetical protein
MIISFATDPGFISEDIGLIAASLRTLHKPTLVSNNHVHLEIVPDQKYR